MFQKQIKIQLSGLVLIMIVLGTGFLLMAPLSPRITVTVVIERPVGMFPRLSVLLADYEKIPMGNAFGATRDTPILTMLSGAAGQYALGFDLAYGGASLSTASFEGLGEGTYQIKVTYLRATTNENKNTPYIITLTLLEYGIERYKQLVEIYPV